VEERHRDEGLVLLTVNLDPPENRPKIPGFLKKYHLFVRVLLGDPDRLKGYDTSVPSFLYVVDRNGVLAAVPGSFSTSTSEMEKDVEAQLPDLLAGKPTPGPVLWAVERAPSGFGLLWRQPVDSWVNDLAIAPPSGGHSAEIGLLTDSHLIRYSASGDLLGDAPLEADNLYELRGADLDGDGKNEWIAAGEERFGLLDGAGELYWLYRSRAGPMRVVDFMDLDGDGSHEIVIQEGSSIVAKKILPGLLWKTPSVQSLRSVVPGPSGTLLVQKDDGIQALDRRGLFLGTPVKVSGEGVLKGAIDLGGGRTLNVLGPPYFGRVDVRHDLDGDGRKDIMVSSRGGITVYSQDGLPLLVLRITQNQYDAPAALEDLDGRPGDELVLAIPDYGLVALGIGPEAKPIAPRTNTSPESAPGPAPPSFED